MIVTGANVSRLGTENSLISGTDLFTTISELAGINVSEIHDSKSFKSLLSSTSTHREYTYSEMNNGSNDMWTIRNDQFKLIVNASGDEKMFDLSIDPYENSNLLNGSLSNEQSQAKLELETELLDIRK